VLDVDTAEPAHGQLRAPRIATGPADVWIGIALARLRRMNETTTLSWDDVRRIADEVQLKLHLAGMDARDRWNQLQPHLAEVEKVITREGGRVNNAVAAMLASIGATLRQLGAEIQQKVDAARTRT
jgi:isopentenyl diphosphate isomerase/L-lactate dehydrogenase-like FMN-dependent dehydrogenase